MISPNRLSRGYRCLRKKFIVMETIENVGSLNLRRLPDVVAVGQYPFFDVRYSLFGAMYNTGKVYYGCVRNSDVCSAA